LLLLLPLPILVRWVFRAQTEEAVALRVPAFDDLAQAVGLEPEYSGRVRRRSMLQAAVFVFCWTLLVLAVARPQLLLPPVTRNIASRDLMLAIDLSGSMGTQDFQDASGNRISRLEAVKTVLAEFLQRREGDRVGMIVFGSGAFVQIPFTQDLAVCQELLRELDVRMAGAKTAFGDAIGLAINVFERSDLDEKVLIALTDGNDTGSRIPVVEAAEIAADSGIIVHTIGVGNPEAVGEELLDEASLREVAEVTGGQYFFAEDRQALASVYDELDRLDTREIETITHRPRSDLYYWPLGLALLLSMLSVITGWVVSVSSAARATSDSPLEARPEK
jgi:Ca-activated chloride channel family protein